MLCAALAGLGLARGAAAQEPQTHSPATPTPYQSPLFHAGGADPNTALTSPPFGVTDPGPPTPLLLNPLYNQLQGTPTGIVQDPTGTGSFYSVQIPSFVLGAYNPNFAPGQGGPTGYYPDHLADGGVYSWQAPFDYLALSTGTVTVDDSASAPTPPAGTTPGTSGFVFTPAGNWQQQTTGPAAGTATGGEYERLPPGTDGTATWTLVATAAGSYSIYYHIPDQIEDASTPPQVETRSTQVTYQIATTGANAMTTTATVSQTEANSSQFLAGPFLLAVGDTVTVTLQRDNRHNQNTEVPVSPATTGAYLIADSMTMQTAIGDVRSSPTAINYSAYPADFARVKYWGIYVTPNTATSTASSGVNSQVQAGASLTTNALPDYGPNSNAPTGPAPAGSLPYIRYGDPKAKQPDGTLVDAVHRVRQLVYFGRQDPAFSNGSTVDDNAPAPSAGTSGFSTGGFSQPTADSTSTATNGEYRIATPVTAGAGPTATWTFIAPNGGDYYATVHLPETQGNQKRVPGPVTKTAGNMTTTVGGVPYTVTYPNVTRTVLIGQDQTGDVTLPTGAIRLNKGDVVTVKLTAATNLPNAPTYTVVADSVRLATGGNGTGAIYCVDGFTGGIVWRFQTPGGLNGPSAPVFSSPVVTKINVLVTPATATAPAVYANKLVVIVGDDNGMVYCLDAIGNGDGTSNANAIDPVSGLPIYVPQPTYNAPTPQAQVDAGGYTPHVGTTGAYWIYRPDPNQPKYVTGGSIGTVKPVSQFDVNSDLPVPAAFGTASPNVFIDPSVSTTPDVNTGALASNARVYVGNSNGVLYALDALGVPIDGSTQARYAATGDRFNASYDLRLDPAAFPAVPADAIVPTPQPLWWFSLRGADANSTNNPSSADIESAPAIHTTATATSVTGMGGVVTTTYAYAPTVYIGSAHEVESTSNVGRLYAINGTYGPAGSNGLSDPSAQPDPTKPNYTGPGSVSYNVGQRPQINSADAADWSFPDAYNRTTGATKNNQGQSSNKLPRPALGNVTGSPVVFTDTNETDVAHQTRIFFAANVGLEVPAGSNVGTAASPRPDETETGRLWAVNLDGSVGRTTRSSTSTAPGTVWAYPLANDPNNAALDKTPEPSAPLGSFLRATPAMGFVQFPSTIINGDNSAYTPTDVIHPGGNGLKGQSVPMLYVATRGVNDTALYAVDVDGGNDTQRLIYRQLSPDGSIFQSSPVVVANTSNVGGNGGAVYVVSENTLYDFSATPISNPITSEAYPLIRENKAYTGFGPISSPAIAAADTTDLLTLTAAQQTTFGYSATDTDWIYVGDSSTGFCRGITPYDTTDLGIPGGLGSIVPPTADAPGAVDLQAIMQVYLVNAANSGSTSATASALPLNGDLPVYDWGQDVYIRFKNVAPPRDPKITPDRVVVDPNAPTNGGPIEAYGDGGPIEFDLSDSTDGTPPDHGTVPAIFLPAANTPLGNGFIGRSDTDPAPSATQPDSLIDPTTNKGYIGAYTYAISDGTARRNTPGSRRRVLNAKQTVHVYESIDGGKTFTDTGRTAVLQVQTTNGNLVSTPNGGTPPSYNLTIVPPVDQPTFGILNPLAVRGGGIPYQLNPGTTPTNAVEIGDPLGPFRSVATPITASPSDLEALTNGNNILVTPPKSTSGGGGGVVGDPTRRNLAVTNPPTTPRVVVTSTGLIAHNQTGDNSDAPPLPTSSNPTPTLPGLPPQGTGLAGEGLTTPTGFNAPPFGSALAPYGADLADRSALGPRQKRLRVKTGTISGGGAGLYWNDNSVPTVGHDHDSVVNFLPWEAAPVGYKIGANPSIDYPDIGPSDISATLFRFSGGTADLTLGNAIAEPAYVPAGSTDPIANRVVRANPIQFHVSIPHFQPANQQVYQRPGAATGYADGFETAPVDVSGNPIITAPLVFPMGYVTTRRIYIPDQGGFYRPGAAYRDVRVYTGVPPDYSTRMDTTTAAVGAVPSGFGIQTSHYGPLNGTITNPQDPTSPLGTFDMFNPKFVSQAASTIGDYFQPLTIYNTGNVNLLNVHLDQKQRLNTNNAYAFSLVSDALDSTSYIPAYDFGGVLTGARSGTYGANGVLEDYFLVRSSLDTDLVAAYGHNPFIQNTANTNAAGVPLINVYPGATFHKAQVGSGNVSTLSVPDSPEGFTPGASLDVSPNLKPVVPNYSTGPVYKALPYVSAAIPFGTPVGSYHGLIQLFEGVDPTGYSTVAAGTDPDSVKQGPFASQGPFAGLTAQIFPPRYGNATGGIGAPSVNPLDTFQFAQAGVNAAGVPNPAVGLMPSSANGTVLNASVVEDRMTDGATFGATAMIDAGPGGRDANKNPVSTPDFAPAAFRDPATGNLSVYWTSGRVGPAYGIYSATVPMLGTAFMPVDPTSPGSVTAPNYVNEWWTSLGNATTGYNSGAFVPALATNQGTNSGLTIAQDTTSLSTLSTIGAFAVNVQAPPLTTAYQNTVLYYPVTANNGALGSAQPITNDPAQVKYGVKGLFTNTAFSSAPSLWAFWTATTRGRTAIYYNSQDPTSKLWVPASGSNTPSTLGVLPIPAGLSAVADPAPLLVFGNVATANGYQGEETIEVTYSGTAPDGKVNLYQSRYQPDADPKKLYQLDLVPYPAVTEILTQTGQAGGWYQARDVAWSRTGQLNLFVNGTPILYNGSNQPLFSRAVFDKATGLLVLTGVQNRVVNSGTGLLAFANTPATGTVTVYLDLATGRARFSATPNAQVRAFFSPLARRITNGSRADTGPTTFLDGQYKANAADPFFGSVKADRRWYVWRKAGAGGASPSASVYYKTQRLTLFLPSPIGLSIPPAGASPNLLLQSVTVNGTDVTKYVDVDYTRGRIYFPINTNGTYPEGMTATATYAPASSVTTNNPNGSNITTNADTVQWEDEEHAAGDITPTDTPTGLNSVTDTLLPISHISNENNVAAFLDTAAYSNTANSVFNPHKVWLFWNSTRNGTADLYYETINPLFSAGP